MSEQSLSITIEIFLIQTSLISVDSVQPGIVKQLKYMEIKDGHVKDTHQLDEILLLVYIKWLFLSPQFFLVPLLYCTQKIVPRCR